MVDVGGGARERFQSVSVEEPDAVLKAGTETYYIQSHPHHTPPPPSSWTHNMQVEGSSGRGSLVECVPPDLLHIKSDPENMNSLCSGSDPGPGVGVAEAAEDARARGRLLQEITRVAETFEPYGASPAPDAGYRNYDLPPESSSESEYILSDTPQWCWSRSPVDDRSLGGSSTGSLLMGSGQPGDTAINSLHYNVASQLIPHDAFSSPLPPISVAQSPIAMPTCSPRCPPLPSALDLSPSPHQLPLLQPSLLAPAPGSSLPPGGHLEVMQPSLMALDLAPHHSLDHSLMVVAGGEAQQPNHQSHQPTTPYTRTHLLKSHTKVHIEEVQRPFDKPETNIQASADSPHTEPIVQNLDRVFKCTHCDQTFSRAEKLKTHEATHGGGERRYSCGECGMTFLAKAMLIRHRKVHTGEKPYRCDVCETYFTEAGSLKVHKRLHSGEKPFKCDVCDVAFNGAGMLATHKRKHTGERPYMCDECGKTFRLLSTLKSHRRRHTGEKPFVCEVCGSSFTQRAAMQRHKRIHSDHKPWECDQCGYKFREKENLRKHVALHKIKLQHICSVCGAGFNQAKRLETHKMLHNGGDRPYQCNKCPSTFTNPKYLTQHKKRVHDKKGTIRCEECNGTFKRKESLRSHMRMHKGVRPYICVECGAAFNQRAPYTKHIRIHGNNSSSNVNDCDSLENKSCDLSLGKSGNHNEDDPYSCLVCSIGFTTQKELVQHKRSTHPAQKRSQASSVADHDDDSSEHIRDKYVCEDCDQTFFRKRQLKAHKKYCPCRCPSYQCEPPEEVETSVPSLRSEPKEVDAMKLLTAALGVTGSDRDRDISQHQHRLTPSPHRYSSPPPLSPHRYSSPPPLSPHRYPSPSPLSPHHYPSHSPLSPQHYPSSSSLSPHQYTSPSPHTTTTTIHTEKHDHHCQDLFTFTTSSISHHQLQHNLIRQDNDHLQLPQLIPLSHLPQLNDLQHQSSDHLQQLLQQNALKQLSEDNILKLAEEHSLQQQSLHHMQQSSYLQQTDNNSSRMHYYSPSLNPPEDPPPQQHHDHSRHLTQHDDHLQQSSRQCSDMEQDHLQHYSRHHTHPQQPMKQHRHLPHTRQQTPYEQPCLEDQLTPSLDSEQHQQRSTHHHHHDVQIDTTDEQQFYKDTSLSLSSQQHFPHHHQSLHLHPDLPQPLPDDVDDCDDLAPSLHHHSHNHNHQLPHHFYQPEEEDPGDSKQHYHHHHSLLQHSKLDDPNDIKIKNEFGTHAFT